MAFRMESNNFRYASTLVTAFLILFAQPLWGQLSISYEQVLKDENSLEVYISKLRGYFKDDPNIQILNIHGEGYRLATRLVSEFLLF